MCARRFGLRQVCDNLHNDNLTGWSLRTAEEPDLQVPNLETLVAEHLLKDQLPGGDAPPAPPTLDAFEGCLVGIALGDMIGLASEGFAPDVCTEYVGRLNESLAHIMEPWEMRVEQARKRGWDGTPSYALGQISDDTQCARELSLSIVEAGGFDVKGFAARLAALHGGEPVPTITGKMAETGVIGQGSTSKYALDRLVEGVSWLSAGSGGPRLSNGSVMRVGPLGLLNWRQPASAQAWASGCLSSYLSHPQTLCMEAGAALATVTAVAAAQGEDVVERSLEALGAQR